MRLHLRKSGRARRFMLDALESRLLLTAGGALAEVTGNGQAIAADDVTPSRDDYTDYAHITVGSAVTRTYTLRNTGTETLTLSGGAPVTFGGANAGDFEVIAAPAATVAAGGSTTFTVRFAPGASGVRTAQLTVASDDPLHPAYIFAIQGLALTPTTLTGGLQIATTEEGTSSYVSQTGHHISVLYTGYLLDGAVFDASSRWGNVPFDFTIGANGVIQGWRYGLENMKVGEKRTLVIPSTMGYGSDGNVGIPPDATLIFETELVSVDGPFIRVAGNGQPISSPDTTPAEADDTAFGEIYVDQTVAHTFTISLAGEGTLYFQGNPNWVILGGANASQFAITQPQISEASATFTVSYKPTRAGAATATITIPTNDALTPNFTFTVGGSAVAIPNLKVALGAVTPSAASYVPGDTIRVPVTITNSGSKAAGASAAAPILVEVRGSADGVFDSGDLLFSTLRITTPIPAGASRTIMASVKLPLLASLAVMSVVGKVDTTGVMTELLESDNTTDGAPRSFSYARIFGNIGRTWSTPTSFTDADGTRVSMSLSGPGVGHLTVTEGVIELLLTGTGPTTNVTITTVKTATPGDDGRFTLGAIGISTPAVPANPLIFGTLTARTVDLAGDLVVAGSARTLTLGGVNAGGPSDLAVDGALATLTIAGSMTGVSVTANKIGTMSVGGDLANCTIELVQPVSATVKALGALTAGRIINSEIRTLGHIGSITTNILDHSRIFAGINPGVTTLPVAADFVDPLAGDSPRIGTLTIRGLASAPTGAAFINSLVAAGRITTVRLPNRASAIGDTDGVAIQFGFASRLAPITYTGPVSLLDFVSPRDGVVSS